MNDKKKLTLSNVQLSNLSSSQINVSENTSSFLINCDKDGYVKYIYFFNSLLDDKYIKELKNKELFKPPVGKPIKTFTKDNRVCRSDCYDKPTPGNIGSPDAPVESINSSSELKEKIQISTSEEKKSNTDTSYKVGSD